MRLDFKPIVVFLCLLILFSFTAWSQNALNFDGSNDYVQTTFSGVLGKADRTFEAWIKLDSNAKGSNCIMDYGFNKVGSRNTFSVNDDGQLIFISGGTNANISSSTNAVDIGVWTHVAFVLDNGTGYFYANGKQVGTGNLTTVNTPSGNTDLRIGERVPGGNIPFLGAIDEVRLWDVARTATEISGNMGAELCATDSHLVAYHKFNQGTAGKNNSKEDESFDLCGRANNGDLKNFSLTGNTSNWVLGYNFKRGEVYGADTLSVCGSFKSPSSKVYTSSGKYIDTISSYMGCDSIITFNLTVIPNPTKTINATSCKIYISPSGQKAWNKSGTYIDILPNPKGCDTIVTINLIVSKRSRDTIYVAQCDSLTSPSGKYIWTKSGEYVDTLASIYNCDSIITVYFSQLQSESIINRKACNSYTSPSGKYIWTQSGTYYDTVANSKSCDSIITINLTVNETHNHSISEFSCKNYKAPSGKYVYTKSGIYKDTITSSTGCDSILTIALTIGQANSAIIQFACDEYISPSGKIWNTSGEYIDTIKTKRGCDSIINITLGILNTSYSNASIAGCGTVTSPSGRHIYTTSGTYIDTIFRQTKCDSIIELEVTIDELQKPEIIRANEQTIESSVIGDSYRWLDCTKNYEEIKDATAKSLEPKTENEYAVEVTKGTCIDTSACYLYMSVQEPNLYSLIKIYPNPASTYLNIKTQSQYGIDEVRIIDLNGKIQFISTDASLNEIDIRHLLPGIYTIELITDKTVIYKNFIKA